MQEELWKTINGYENYEISNFGRYRTKERFSIRKDKPGLIIPAKILVLHLHRDGYLSAKLSKNSKQKTVFIHRLVAEHFIPNALDLPEINHKDGDKTNNKIDNLEWVTKKQNAQHAVNNNLRPNVKGELNPVCKLSEKEVIEIFKSKETLSFLSKNYNVSKPTICDIKSGRRWGWLTNKFINIL